MGCWLTALHGFPGRCPGGLLASSVVDRGVDPQRRAPVWRALWCFVPRVDAYLGFQVRVPWVQNLSGPG